MQYGKTCETPGYYWYREAKGIPAVVVQVRPDYEEPNRFCFIHKDTKTFVDEMRGELFGPVQEPPFSENATGDGAE